MAGRSPGSEFKLNSSPGPEAGKRCRVVLAGQWVQDEVWALDGFSAILTVICGGMPDLKEETLFHDSSVGYDSARVPTGPNVSPIRVIQPEGHWVIPELLRGVITTQTLAEGEGKQTLNWEGERSRGED